MKKALALVLSVLLAMGTLAVAASANTITYTASKKYTSSNEIVAGDEYIIPDGITMTVPSDVTLYIPSGATLTVEEGGVLTVYGTIVVLDGGKLIVKGTINHATNVSTEGSNAIATAAVTIPAIADYMASSVTFTPTVKFSYYANSDGVKHTADVTAGDTVNAQLGTEMSVIVTIAETEYDPAYMTVYADGVKVDYVQGKCPMKVTDAHKITFEKAQNNADFYKDCKILLPTGKGYEAVGRNGEMTEDGTVLIKYGTYFSFRLDIDEDYDRSDIDLYIYDGYGYFNLDTDNGYLADKEALTPDADGYYTIYVDGDKTVQVEGAVSNEALGTVTGIMDIIKNIMDMITSFLQKIAALLGLKK